MVTKLHFLVVISVVEKRQFWVAIRVVTKGKFLGGS